MTLREATALIALYRACADPEARTRAEALVPDLAEWRGAEMVPFEAAKRWRLTASVDDHVVSDKVVVARHADLDAHREQMRAELDLAPGKVVISTTETRL